jgi:hypothetical protein
VAANQQNFDYPSNTPIVGDKVPTLAWLQVFQRWQTVVASEAQSGSTANRPTKSLWIGRRFFDTTLGYPVYVKQVKPSVVWVNGSGTPV